MRGSELVFSCSSGTRIVYHQFWHGHLPSHSICGDTDLLGPISELSLTDEADDIILDMVNDAFRNADSSLNQQIFTPHYYDTVFLLGYLERTQEVCSVFR